VSLLVVAGLGLTASGTSAATALDGVSAAVTAELQAAVPPAPAAPTAPVAPVAPAAPDRKAVRPAAPTPPDAPVPPAPPTPPETAADDDVSTTVTRDGRHIRKHVVRIRDGKLVDDRVVLADVPEIDERTCRAGKDGSDKQLVLHSREGKKRVMIICTNRIERVAAEGAAIAANSKDIERHALESALAGLRSAHASIAANHALTGAERARALAGIQEGLAELQADLAKAR
jgi:hypothetical protein